MAYRTNRQLREEIWDYRDRSPSRDRENILRFPRADEEDYSETTLDLVNHAAELFESMESHAREREASAQSLCKSLAEKLLQVERQKETAERAQLETITELNRRLQEAVRALKHAEKRIESAEDYATAAEFRAQAAEGQLFKVNRELADVEKAIRTRLL
jgi:chromosome segregation ATPase